MFKLLANPKKNFNDVYAKTSLALLLIVAFFATTISITNTIISQYAQNLANRDAFGADVANPIFTEPISIIATSITGLILFLISVAFWLVINWFIINRKSKTSVSAILKTFLLAFYPSYVAALLIGIIGIIISLVAIGVVPALVWLNVFLSCIFGIVSFVIMIYGLYIHYVGLREKFDVDGGTALLATALPTVIYILITVCGGLMSGFIIGLTTAL